MIIAMLEQKTSLIIKTSSYQNQQNQLGTRMQDYHTTDN